MLEEVATHIGTEADVSAHVLDINGKRTQLRRLLKCNKSTNNF